MDDSDIVNDLENKLSGQEDIEETLARMQAELAVDYVECVVCRKKKSIIEFHKVFRGEVRGICISCWRYDIGE